LLGRFVSNKVVGLILVFQTITFFYGFGEALGAHFYSLFTITNNKNQNNIKADFNN